MKIYKNTSTNTTDNKKNYSDINFEGMLERIDILIKKNNITQKKLCDSIGISSPAISSLRKTKGVPNAITAWKIADFFNVSTDWLITGKERETKLDIENQLVLDTLSDELETIKQKFQKLKLFRK